MFLALRDLRYAKGRFALIGGVIALITVLVVMLSGLAAGLGRASISAVSSLPEQHVDMVMFSEPASGQALGFGSSRVDDESAPAARKVAGVKDASVLTMAPARVSVQGSPTAATVFAVSDGGFGAPAQVRDGQVVVGTDLAKDGALHVGDTVTLSSTRLRVAAISDSASYQHTPVVWMTAADAARAGVPLAGATSVILADTGPGFDAATLQRETHLVAKSPADAVSTIESYQAENGSLTLMRVMLLLVSALVVGAFFTVWTIQRTPDLAVLKAMGARTRALVIDAVGQAALLLIIGGGLGAGIAAVAGLAVRGTVPFVVTPSTMLTPLVLLFAVGLIGALVSVRRIATVDPVAALASAH